MRLLRSLHSLAKTLLHSLTCDLASPSGDQVMRRYIQCELISFKKTCFHVAGFIVVHPVDMFFLVATYNRCRKTCMITTGNDQIYRGPDYSNDVYVQS